MYLMYLLMMAPFYQTSTFTRTLTTGSKTWNPSGLWNGIYRYVKYVQRLWERIWWHLSFWSFAWFQALFIPIWDDDLMFSEWVAQPAHLGASSERVFPPSGLHTTARRPRSSLGGWLKGTSSLAGRCCPGFPEFIPIYIHVRHRIDWILEATALLKPYDVKVACSKKVNVHKHVHSYKILQTCIKL